MTVRWVSSVDIGVFMLTHRTPKSGRDFLVTDARRLIFETYIPAFFTDCNTSMDHDGRGINGPYGD